jgi:hypothetical protein
VVFFVSSAFPPRIDRRESDDTQIRLIYNRVT